LITRALPFRPARADWLQAAIVALLLFALYAATSPRTVAMEDDGLFVLSSYFLGIEHPPGFPIHTLLGKLFTLLPFGSVAYRVHLLSALLGALSGAALWLCARALFEGRIAATLAALGLGLSRTFWSQAIIAEVYTLNTLFVFVLVYLGLRACPQGASASGKTALPLWAFVFGLSLANHWPLMLLVAPGLAVLLLPRAREALRRAPLLVACFALGLTPYAWMVVLSWGGLPISFVGPIESPQEFWHFVSRAGYADVDVSKAATWIDRIRFFGFQGQELLSQFAYAGTLVAATGFAVQWRLCGTRIAWFLTLAFLGPTALLLLLLGFEYDSLHKHMYQVYPLPAYGIAALWMGLGFAWLVRRFALRRALAASAGAALLALIFAAASRTNLLADYDWAARYANAVLSTLPRNAVLVVRGDTDLAPIGYFHMVEGRRPDITLYQPQGFVLGNRLFHPLRTRREDAAARVGELLEQEANPVALAQWDVKGHAKRDRWLYVVLDKASADPDGYIADVPEELLRFLEQSVLAEREVNAWAAFFQSELRRRYAKLLAQTLPRERPPDARASRHIEALANDFLGALGLVEGQLANRSGYAVSQAVRFLERARALMPPDAAKSHKARFFELRAYVRLGQGDERGATEDLEASISVWPVQENPAAIALSDLYAKAGNHAGVEALRSRLKP